MAEILQIIELGDLPSRAQLVNDIQDERIQKLIDDLIVTAVQANGLGLPRK